MLASIPDNQKKGRGRPATGITPMSGVRFSDDLKWEITGWAAEQEDQPSFAEAVRRLVKLGLKRQRRGK
jgi:hypothetical protein